MDEDQKFMYVTEEKSKEIEEQMPPNEIAYDLADLYKVYTMRRSINEQLKSQIKDICPILIRGSLEEGK